MALNRVFILRAIRPTICTYHGCHSSINPSQEPPDNDLTIDMPKGVPRSRDEFRNLKTMDVIQPEGAKSLKVAIIGRPNAGKSTLLNKLLGHRVSSVSSKVHTTRENVIGVLTEGSTQIEFLDTPGLIRLDECIKHNMEHTLFHHPHRSAKITDLLLVVIDISKNIYRHFLSTETFKLLLKHKDKKSILVLNKVDCVKKKQILLHCVDSLTGCYIEGEPISQDMRRTSKPVKKKAFTQNELKKVLAKAEGNYELLDELKETEMDNYEEKSDDKVILLDPEINKRSLYWPYFSRVFMISALEEDGVDDLKEYLISQAKPQNWKYPSAVLTNQKPEQIIIATIREKFLEYCLWDIPYTTQIVIGEYRVDELENIHILVYAYVVKEYQIAFVVGGKGITISKIVDQARQELSDTFRCDVRLRIIVKCSQVKKK